LPKNTTPPPIAISSECLIWAALRLSRAIPEAEQIDGY